MQRHIILAGGTGFLGTLLARYFVQQGGDVVVLTRGKVRERGGLPKIANQETIRMQRSNQGGEAEDGDVVRQSGQGGSLSFVRWDGCTLGNWTTTLDGAEAVINLAGRSVNCRYHQRNRELIMNSRINATRVIGEAIGRSSKPPRVWLNLSTATIYKHTFGRAWDEHGEIGATPQAKDAFSVEVATAWERTFEQARTPHTRKVALRSAMVFGLSDDANNVFRVLRRLVRWGLGGRMGSGRQFVSWIHQTDFCRAVDFLLTHEELVGPVNLAAPNPIANAEMMRTFRSVLARPIGIPAMEWMLELGAFLLRTETELIIKSRRVISSCLREAGFRFEFDRLEEAIRDLERGSR